MRTLCLFLVFVAALFAELPQPRMYTTGMKQGYMSTRAVPNASGTSPIATQLVPMSGMIAWHVPEDLSGSDLTTIGWSTSTIPTWVNRADPSKPAASNNVAYNCQVRTNVIGSWRGVQCGAASTPCGSNCGFLVMPVSYDIQASTWIFVIKHNSPISGTQNGLQLNGGGNVTFGGSVGPGGAGNQKQQYSWNANMNGNQYGNGFGIQTSASPQIIGYSMGANGPWFYQNGIQRHPWGDGAGLEDNANVWTSQPGSLTNSNVYLGGNTCNNCTWPGVILEVLAWNRQLSRQEVQAVMAYLNGKYPQIGRGLVNLVQYGDSIELGQGSSWGTPQGEGKYVGRAAGAVPSVTSWGYSGKQWITQESKQYTKYFVGSAYDLSNSGTGLLNPFAKKNVLLWKFGANDFWASFQSAASMKIAVNAMIADFKAKGWDEVHVGTIIPRYLSGAFIAGEVQAKLFNTWLLAGTVGGDSTSFQGDGVIDYTSISCFTWGDGSNNHVLQITQNKADDGTTPVLDPTAAGGCYASGDQTHPSDYGHAARALLEYNYWHTTRGLF
jgi:hypothetical protein